MVPHVVVSRPQVLIGSWPETPIPCDIDLSTAQLTTWQLTSIRESKREGEKQLQVCQHSLVFPGSPSPLRSKLERMVKGVSKDSGTVPDNNLWAETMSSGCGICSKSAFNILSYFSQIWE